MQRQGRGRRLSRRAIVCLAGIGASAAVLGVSSPVRTFLQTLTPRRRGIAFLSPGPREAREALIVEPFLEGLRDLGYVEGHNIDIEWRFTVSNIADRDRDLIAEVLRLSVELIVVTSSTPTAFAVRDIASTIPVLAMNVSYPVETGLVASLARPGAGNLTALTSNAYGVNAKRLQLLRDVVPSLERVVALVDVSTPAYDVVVWNEFKNAAAQAGLQIERINLRSADDLEEAFVKRS